MGRCHAATQYHKLNDTYGALPNGAYAPQCEQDGSYKRKQCYGSTGYCWCAVSLTGILINGTMSNQHGNISCDKLSGIDILL